MPQKISFTGAEGSSSDISSSRIVIFPVPYDGTSTWMKGSDKGPKAILEASPQLEMYDIETRTEVCRQGIYTLPEARVEEAPGKLVKAVEKKVKSLLDGGKFVVTIGGEHSVSIGAIKAFSESFRDMTVLQLDAHADLRESYEGSKFNHACVMARAAEVSPFVQVGIRSVFADERSGINDKNMFYAHDIVKDAGWVKKVVKCLSSNVYVTIDLDVFDPSIMPSTGTPEPGGLDWYKVTDLLREVAGKRNVVGFDVVELCPSKNDKAPDFLAAKLIYKFLSYIYAKRGCRGKK